MQKDSIADFVKSQGKDWNVVSDYTDSRSAKTTERPGLKRMLKDAEEKKFDAIVVYKIDRLSRNVRDFVEITKALEKAGVALKSVTEPIDTGTPLGKVLLYLLAIFAQFESDLIVERTTLAMQKKAKNGEWGGGTVPYGYSYIQDEKRLTVNESEKALVERILSLYTEKGMGGKSIARKLNREGYRTRKGRRWSVDAITRILRSPLYIGKIVRRDTVYPGKHPHLISEEVWKKAQIILDERTQKRWLRRSNGSDYLLSGLLRCVPCRAHIIGASAHGRSSLYQYYGCSSKMKYGECELPLMPKKPIEEAILGQLKEIFTDTSFISRLLEKVNSKLREKIPLVEAQLELVERKIKEKEALINLYFEKFEKEKSLSRLVKQRLEEINTELEQLKQTRDKFQEEAKTQPFEPANSEDIRKIIVNLQNTLALASRSEAKKLLRLVVKRIDVHSPHFIEPYYRVPSVRVMSGSAPRAGLEPTQRC